MPQGLANHGPACVRPRFYQAICYLRFLDIAFASCRELAYLGTLSSRLGFIDKESAERIDTLGGRTAAAIAKLRQALRQT